MQFFKKIVTYIVKSNQVNINGMHFDVNNHYYWPWVSMGLWEPKMIGFYKKNIYPGSSVIDIGAYFGGTALIAYSIGASKVHCIEADPENFQILQGNINKNNLQNFINAENFAIYSKTGEILNFGYRSDDHKTESTKTFSEKGLPVQTITLLDYLSGKNLKNTSLIKIDIEGAEKTIGPALQYISDLKTGIKVCLSVHTPFFDDKKEVYNELLPYLNNFSITDLSGKTIGKNKLEDDFLSEKRCGWKNLTGKFFCIALNSEKTR